MNVKMTEDPWESLSETLFWLSRPGIHEDVTRAVDSDSYSAADVRARYGLPPPRIRS